MPPYVIDEAACAQLAAGAVAALDTVFRSPGGAKRNPGAAVEVNDDPRIGIRATRLA